jgi:hypothetical protein
MLEAELGKGAVYLDATDATDLDTILTAVASAKALLLVLTKSVLERPWVLLELYEAISRSLPVLCVHVVGGGYDFASAAAYLNDLETQLGDRDAPALDELRSKLGERGVPLPDLQVRHLNAPTTCRPRPLRRTLSYLVSVACASRRRSSRLPSRR